METRSGPPSKEGTTAITRWLMGWIVWVEETIVEETIVVGGKTSLSRIIVQISTTTTTTKKTMMMMMTSRTLKIQNHFLGGRSLAYGISDWFSICI